MRRFILAAALLLAASTSLAQTQVVTTPGSSGSTGTVTSVALAAPADLTVSGSPVTTTGTLTFTRASQLQNLFMASPSGSAGTPFYRAIVALDLPAIAESGVTSLTSDLSTLTTNVAANASAIALKAPTASPTFTGTVGGVTATMVGLGSVNNTSDAAKPISTATQTALNLLAPLASPGLTGVPTGPTAAAATNTTQLATTAFVLANQAVTTVADRTGAVTLAVADVAGAAPLASPALTGTPTAPTAAPATNSTQLATTAYADALGALKLNLTGGTLTGQLVAAATGIAFNGSKLLATGANIVGQSNGVNAQTLQLYNTTNLDGASCTVCEWLSVDWTTIANAVFIGPKTVGGTLRLLMLGSNATAKLTIAPIGIFPSADILLHNGIPGNRWLSVASERVLGGGTAPTVATTGFGTTPTNTVDTGSSDLAGTITVTAGTTPGNTGTLTLTFSTIAGAYGSNPPVCIAMLGDGTGAWNIRGTIRGGAFTTTTAAFSWDNNAVALTAASTYKIHYHCIGK